MNYNKVTLAGNLTRDPELRFTPSGKSICKFGLAINRRWKSETGEAKEETTFLDVDCFGKTAETIEQYFKKGRSIFIEGRLKLDTWDDKATGQKRSKLGVIAESFVFPDSKPDGDEAPRQIANPAAAEKGFDAMRKAAEPLTPVAEDDVPF